MNDNLNTPTTEFKPVPTTPLSDAELQKLLETKPVDGTAAFVTDADETDDGLADFGPETKPTLQ